MATLRAAQQGVRDGTAFFPLLAGAPASYEVNGTGPRDSFLTLEWRHLRFAELLETGNPYSRGYRLSVMPDGLGQLYWDVRVVLTADGGIGRVEMLYGPPAPF